MGQPGRDRREGWRRRLASALAIAAVCGLGLAGNVDLEEPPRFDGAGYAMLAEALMTGRGYRDIAHPEAPRHAHFPPGYPAALAILWRVAGRSAAAAHAFSIACTLAATLAAWGWFRRMYPPGVALLLGLALAANWSWGRMGGSIQSEPLFFLLEQAAVLLLRPSRPARGGGIAAGAAAGVVIGLAALTRHVGLCLAIAALIDLATRRRLASAAALGLVAGLIVLPWIGWVLAARHGTQVELLVDRKGEENGPARQALFYLRRLPDRLTGPVVEVATVYRPSAARGAAVDLWAVAASGTVLLGWARAVRCPRRRLAGLVPLCTLGLLLAWPFTEAGRFLVPLVPFVLVGAVEGLAPLLARARLRRPRAWAAGALLAASLPYSVYGLATDRAGAQRRTHADYDAACAWIARAATRPGPVLASYPGEVHWLTRRLALPAPSDRPGDVARAIEAHRVAYLIVDDDRYSKAPANPLGRYVARHPGLVRRAWTSGGGRATVAVYEVIGPAMPITPTEGRP